MPNRLNSWTRWLKLIIAVTVAAGFLIAAFTQTNKPAGRENLKIQLTELRSQAVQSALLAETVLSRTTTAAYIEGQLSFVRDKTDETLDTLKAAKPESGLRPFFATAYALGDNLRNELSILLASYQDDARVNTAASNLRNLLQQMLALEANLSA
jgi:hypothetical protein